MIERLVPLVSVAVVLMMFAMFAWLWRSNGLRHLMIEPTGRLSLWLGLIVWLTRTAHSLSTVASGMVAVPSSRPSHMQ